MQKCISHTEYQVLGCLDYWKGNSSQRPKQMHSHSCKAHGRDTVHQHGCIEIASACGKGVSECEEYESVEGLDHDSSEWKQKHCCTK